MVYTRRRGRKSNDAIASKWNQNDQEVKGNTLDFVTLPVRFRVLSTNPHTWKHIPSAPGPGRFLLHLLFNLSLLNLHRTVHFRHGVASLVVDVHACNSRVLMSTRAYLYDQIMQSCY
jgi:hypothetical protein